MLTIPRGTTPEWEMSRDAVAEMAAKLTIADLAEREQAAGVRLGPYHREWLLQHRAPWRVRRDLELARRHPSVVATRGYSMGMDANDFPTFGSFTAVTASATETLFWQNPAVWTPVPALDMRPGKAYKLSFGGIYTSTATQGTLTWTPREGGTAGRTFGASGAIAPTASVTNGPLYGEFTFGVRTVDTAYTAIAAVGSGFVQTGGGTVNGITYVMGGTVTSAVSNAAATSMNVDLTISVASQSYTCQWIILQSAD